MNFLPLACAYTVPDAHAQIIHQTNVHSSRAHKPFLVRTLTASPAAGILRPSTTRPHVPCEKSSVKARVDMTWASRSRIPSLACSHIYPVLRLYGHGARHVSGWTLFTSIYLALVCRKIVEMVLTRWGRGGLVLAKMPCLPAGTNTAHSSLDYCSEVEQRFSLLVS